MNQPHCTVARNLWIRALNLVPVDEIKIIVDDVLTEYEMSYKALPQSGLGVLKTKDTAFHELYFLGEFPIAMSWVVLKNQQGDIFEGAAQIMDDDDNLASLFAICDAVLAHNLSGWHKLNDLVEMGEFKFAQEVRTRKAMLGSTAVNFSLLSESENSKGKQGA